MRINSKTKKIVISLLTVAFLLSCVQVATAQTKTKTYAFLAIVPDDVVLGESILANSWTTPQPPMIPGTSDGQPREGYYYDFTKPDGSIDTVGPRTSDGPGTDWFMYTPDQAGTWKVKFRWGGDELFEACESPESTFIVRASGESVPKWPAAPLPTDEPWTRPISAANREWAVLGGAWVSSTGRDTPCFNPYSTGPTSSHILWKLETRMGGLIGGSYGATAYSSSAPSKVIMFGRAYFASSDGVHCVDVHTGKELWVPAKNMGSGTMFAIPGPTPYIWRISANRFERFNAETGASTKNVTGQPTAAELTPVQGAGGWRINRSWMDDNGLLYINYDDVLERFAGDIVYDTKSSSTSFWAGVVFHLERESMNSSTVNLYEHPYGNATKQIVESYYMPPQDLANMAIDTENKIIFHASNGGKWTAAVNATNGKLLWNIERDFSIEGQCAVINGVGSCGATDTMRVYGIDLFTGDIKWESEPADYPWGGFRAYSSAAAYNKMYHLAYDGTVRAYDANTGEGWTYRGPVDQWGETPYGQWPFYNNPAVADNKIYATTSEHTPTLPLKRGDRLYALDANTGQFLWSILGCNSQLAIADGVLVASDSYMPIMYGFAKGQTATTVSVSPKVTAKDCSVIIEGTVMDMSPAQPNTPAVSDDSMTGWMEYLHMQQPKPTNTTGVQVRLTAVDESGNTVPITTVTSDASGFYSAMWTPTTDGKYTIVAEFAGSESYYPSSAKTAVGVAAYASGSPAVTPSDSPSIAPDPQALPNADMYILIAAAVVIIAVIAVAVVLRRRK